MILFFFSLILGNCANGYLNYDLSDSQICVKYFPIQVSYSSARANCQAEGGDLIKIDSPEKFDMFKEYYGMFSFCIELQRIYLYILNNCQCQQRLDNQHIDIALNLKVKNS